MHPPFLSMWRHRANLIGLRYSLSPRNYMFDDSTFRILSWGCEILSDLFQSHDVNHICEMPPQTEILALEKDLAYGEFRIKYRLHKVFYIPPCLFFFQPLFSFCTLTPLMGASLVLSLCLALIQHCNRPSPVRSSVAEFLSYVAQFICLCDSRTRFCDHLQFWN